MRYPHLLIGKQVGVSLVYSIYFLYFFRLPTFLVRYCEAQLDSAGLIVGTALVIGGISGNILGAQSAAYFEPRVKSSYFLIPALYTLPAAFLFLLINNETSNLNLVYFYIFLSMIFCWTFVAPLAAVTVNVIRPSLRSLAGGLAHLVVSILGNIISPPIVGAISDDTGSLRTAMQSVWVTTLGAGVCWFCGYYFLPALGDMSGNDGDKTQDALSLSDFLFHGGIAAPGREPKNMEPSDRDMATKGHMDDIIQTTKDNDTVVDNSQYMSKASKVALKARRANYTKSEQSATVSFNPLLGSISETTVELKGVADTVNSVPDSDPSSPKKASNQKAYTALSQEV